MRKKNKSFDPTIKKHPGGRPSTYTKELGERICRAVASSTATLNEICASNEDFPFRNTIWSWRLDYPEFANLYAHAKRMQADLFAEEIMEISDNSKRDSKINASGEAVCDTEWVSRSRLRVDTRKWIACKLLPKVYGEQKTIEEVTSENAALKEEMRVLRESLDAKNKKEF